VLEGDPWLAGDGRAVLRLRPGGTPFVQVGVHVARVRIPVAEVLDSVFVELSGKGWHVAGHLDAQAFCVHPARILMFYGFLVPTELADLRVTRARPGELMLTAAPPPPLKLAGGPLPAEPATCQDVSIAPPQPLGAETALFGSSDSRQRAYVAQRGVPLRLDPEAEPIAWFAPTEGPQPVDVLEKRDAYTRIALVDHTTLALGWVRTGDLVMPRRHDGQSPGARGPTMGMVGQLAGGATTSEGNRVSERTGYRCNTEVSLVVDVRGELMQVGSIDPGTRLATAERAGGLVHLVPPQSISAVDGATFGIAESELARCEPEP
jgi:hypothetical protein